jgi:hypothetical protein
MEAVAALIALISLAGQFIAFFHAIEFASLACAIELFHGRTRTQSIGL